MYCGECGSKISDDAKFCPACGAKTEKAASASAEASFFTAEESAKESPAPWTGLDHGPLQASRAGGAGDLGGQIKAVRARSRRKMPQLFLLQQRLLLCGLIGLSLRLSLSLSNRATLNQLTLMLAKRQFLMMCLLITKAHPTTAGRQHHTMMIFRT